jgi:hypothetical protein
MFPLFVPQLAESRPQSIHDRLVGAALVDGSDPVGLFLLLRVSYIPAENESQNNNTDPQPFSILRHSSVQVLDCRPFDSAQSLP